MRYSLDGKWKGSIIETFSCMYLSV